MAFDYIPLWDRYKELFEPLEDEEIGRLIRVMMEYKDGGDPQPKGNERFAWPSVRRDIDQARAAYENECERQRKNGTKGGRPPKEQKPSGFFENPKNPVVFSENPKNPVVFEKTQKSKNKTNQSKANQDISPDGESIAPDGAAPAKETKKSFGQYGWVKLTDGEYRRLLNDLGQAEVERCIAYIDESAQSSGNKNHWRDWNLVVRRCHRDGWGPGTAAGKSPGKPVCSDYSAPDAGDRLRSDMDKLAAMMGGESE